MKSLLMGLICIACITSACSAEVGDSADPVGVAENDIVNNGEFFWAQNQVPTSMGSDANQACFLTRVAGQFVGGGEVVRAIDNNGQWVLTGASQQAGVSGAARCVPLTGLTMSQEFFWSQASGPTRLLATNSGALKTNCFLSGITGHFAGFGEVAHIFNGGDGFWYLGGTSQQAGVGGWARCLTGSSLPGPNILNWNFGTTTFNQDTQAASPRSTCLLAGMGGEFNGGGEQINVHITGTEWFIAGSSLSGHGVWAFTECF